MISTNTFNSWWPDVAVDAWGQPHVVWSSGRPGEEEQMDLLMYSTALDQEWTEPNDIAVTAYGGYTIRPAITTDRSGSLHVTFRGETTIYYTSASVTDGWNAASWTARRRISGAGNGTAYYSDIAVDEGGTIHVVWNEGITPEADETWLWLGTSQGALLYDDRGRRAEIPLTELQEREVRAVIEDEIGVQWFGTDAGLYRFDGSAWERFTVLDGLIAQGVNCLAEDADGDLWIGTDFGVSHYLEEERDNKWTAYTVGAGLPGSTVLAMALDSLGVMWFGTAQGLASYDGQNWVNYTTQAEPLATEILALAVDTGGNLWVGTRQGVSQYDGQQWTSYTTEYGLPGNVVTAIAVDRQGAVWFATDNGLSRFDGQAWTSYGADEALLEGAITALYVDSKDVVWVGHEGGLSFYDGQTWTAFALPPELAEQQVRAIAGDRQMNAMCPSCADIFYRRSTDGGRSWTAPVNLSGSLAGSAKPQVRVDSEGSVYVAWEEGEDWYLYAGYPSASMYIHSPDGGYNWAEPTVFTSTLGAPQQVTLGVGRAGNVIVVWRLPEQESFYYYQSSTDRGATWSAPEVLPGLVAKPWLPFSLDAYDAATDSAGNVHMLLLGTYSFLEQDLGVMHLVWDGSAWSSPSRVFASSDPPEWPRIDIGQGNQAYATWFTRDERHIEDPERGRYKVWVSSFQAGAPPEAPPARPGLPSTSTPSSGDEGQAVRPTTTPYPQISADSSMPPAGLDTESDELGRLAVALLPVLAIVILIIGIRLGWPRRRG